MISKWLNCELRRNEWELLQEFLESLHISYEASDAGERIHIELYVNPLEAAFINSFLDNL